MLRSLLPLLPLVVRRLMSGPTRRLMMQRLAMRAAIGALVVALMMVASGLLVWALYLTLRLGLPAPAAAALVALLLIIVALLALLWLGRWERRLMLSTSTGMPPTAAAAQAPLMSEPLAGGSIDPLRNVFGWIASQPMTAVAMAIAIGAATGLFNRDRPRDDRDDD